MSNGINNESIGMPVVTREGDCFNVVLQIIDGYALFKFESPVYVRNELEATLLATVAVAGLSERIFDSRINVYSNSSKETYARALTSAFGKEISWIMVLSQVCSAFSKAYKETMLESVKKKSQIIARGTNYLITPFIEENSPNIIFGKGGSGKTFLALRMAMSLASGATFLAETPTKKVKTLFLDYENSESTFSHRINQMASYCHGYDLEHEDNLFYYSPGGIPLHELKDTLKILISKNDIDLLIIDSAALACGGAPEDAQNAIRFFNAINSLGITSLVIAHETKAENGNYVFGSVFFHNSARNIWNVKVDREQEDNVIHVGLLHRKSNNDRLQSPKAARIYFGDGFVDINQENSLDRFSEEFGLKTRILSLLKSGPKTLDEIASDLSGSNKNTIKSRLNELRNSGKVFGLEHGTWGLVFTTIDAQPVEKVELKTKVTGQKSTEELFASL
jgi:hypothetical protein